MTAPEPQARDESAPPEAQVVALGAYTRSHADLERLRERSGGGGDDPALRDLLALARHVDRQAADLLGPAHGASGRQGAHSARVDRRRGQRWAKVIPVAACLVLLAAGLLSGTGADDRDSTGQTAIAPVAAMLDAAEADLQSAAAADSDQQAALVEHSRELVAKAESALPRLSGPDRDRTRTRIQQIVSSPLLTPVTAPTGPTATPVPQRPTRPTPSPSRPAGGGSGEPSRPTASPSATTSPSTTTAPPTGAPTPDPSVTVTPTPTPPATATPSPTRPSRDERRRSDDERWPPTGGGS
jgi:hypothetical protein